MISQDQMAGDNLIQGNLRPQLPNTPLNQIDSWSKADINQVRAGGSQASITATSGGYSIVWAGNLTKYSLLYLFKIYHFSQGGLGGCTLTVPLKELFYFFAM